MSDESTLLEHTLDRAARTIDGMTDQVTFALEHLDVLERACTTADDRENFKILTDRTAEDVKAFIHVKYKLLSTLLMSAYLRDLLEQGQPIHLEAFAGEGMPNIVRHYLKHHTGMRNAADRFNSQLGATRGFSTGGTGFA